MARPYKSGQEKAVIVSVSISPAMKTFFETNNISPSKLFQELFIKHLNLPQEQKQFVEDKKKEKIRSEIMQALDEAKKIYLEKLKPEGNYLKKQKQFESLVSFLIKKYPSLSKATIYSYVERETGYFEIEEPKQEGEANVL
jgi:hypothetical protein